MLGTDFVGYAHGLIGQAVSSPGAAAWFQAVGSLVTLLAASLIPWLRGQARQRAFRLRARLLVQFAQINIMRMERSLEITGELNDLQYEIQSLSDEFTTFPVEELSQDVATKFHECRLAFINVSLAIGRVKEPEGVLRPYSRVSILRLIQIFHIAFKRSGKIFNRNGGIETRMSKSEQKIIDSIEARLPEFKDQWRKYKEGTEQNESGLTSTADLPPS